MQYFTPDFIDFFKDLAANNNRDWFHANKKRYEKSIKKPFQSFVEGMINAAQEIDPTIQITPKQAIFRINRDIRFSKDKSPYKLFSSAVISSGGRKDPSDPNGMYIEINPEELRLYGGVYRPDKEQLYNIRQAIASNNSTFSKIISEKKFVKTFGGIQGEKNKRIPKEFKEAGVEQPLIYNKQFYYFTDIGIKHLTSDKLIPTIISKYKIMRPIGDFLTEALQTNEEE